MRLSWANAEPIERAAKLAQNITIIVGVFAGIVTVVTNQYERRVQRTLDLRKEYIDKIRPDYLALTDQWDADPESAKVLTVDIPQQKQIVLKFFQDAAHRRELENYLDFFDTMYTCIDNRACDKNTALYLFKAHARSIFEFAAPYIYELRKLDRDPSVGEGLETFYNSKPASLIAR
jgi:hypothetical protein